MKKNNHKEYKNNHADANVSQAVIAGIANKQCQILIGNETFPCQIPGALQTDRNTLTVGDRVEVSPAGGGQYRLVSILPRETALYRGDRRSPGEEILVAANAQYLLAMVTADYLLNQAGYLETATIAARRAGLEVGLFISQWDLTGERARALLEDKLNLYRGCADAVFAGSSLEANDELLQVVKGKTVVVTGDRACGKTALIQAILGRLCGGDASREKLPSTHASVLHVGTGQTFLIDTPGFRSFALRAVMQEERSAVFPEIAALAQACRFGNCTHVHEDGCRVVEGLRAGSIQRARYDAYQAMAEKAPASMEPVRSADRVDYRHSACTESFVCKVCGALVVPDGAGSQHRNHCPKCLSSVHVDNKPGDRASLCDGIMDPVSVWVRKGGEWAIIHRCRLCGAFSSNRIAADDNPMLLMSIAVKPLSMPPFPLGNLSSL